MRELTAGDVEAADRVLPLSRLDSVQTYLVAWNGNEPIGNAHIAWQNTTLGLPEVQDVFVVPTQRRRGVATEMMLYAEQLAASRGYARISLSYGIANEAACRLYEGLGYADAGLPPQRVQGTITIRGEPVEIDDTLIYLVKDLAVDSASSRSS